MITIPVQITDEDILKIDLLVKQGRYKSRNQAVRKMLSERISEESIVISDENPEKIKKRQELLSLLTKRKIPFEMTLLENKSAVDLIMEQRERE